MRFYAERLDDYTLTILLIRAAPLQEGSSNYTDTNYLEPLGWVDGNVSGYTRVGLSSHLPSSIAVAI